INCLSLWSRINYMMKNLSEYLDTKYAINTDSFGIWSLDDMRRSWGKAQRIGDGRKTVAVDTCCASEEGSERTSSHTGRRIKGHNGKKKRSLVVTLSTTSVTHPSAASPVVSPSTTSEVMVDTSASDETSEEEDGTYKWSKELPHPKKGGLKTWTELSQLKNIYSLHPNDDVQVLSVMVSADQACELSEEVMRSLGNEGQELADGWACIRRWLEKFKSTHIYWAKVSDCYQKSSEEVSEFAECFKQVWLEYAGVLEVTEENYETSHYGPLKTTFVDGLKTELAKMLKVSRPDWKEDADMRRLVRLAGNIKNDIVTRIRMGQTGHWAKACHYKGNACSGTKEHGTNETDVNARFQQLTMEQKTWLLSAIEPKN
uniref:Uncharacterized protein n=1 Tax=Paramormyrops kingsleyae TaxID=1676925 RepID=A0A3B3SJZ8_9TELE